MRTLSLLIATLLIIAGASVASALPVHNVTQATDHATIQDAIDNAFDGDLIQIDDGVYTEQVSISGVGVTLEGQSEAGTIVEANAVLTSGQNTFTIDAAGKTVTIRQMTIRNGHYGIRSSNGDVNVMNCTLLHNGWDGTNLPAVPTEANMLVFWTTYATNGGAVRIQNATASEIAHNTVYENDRGIRLQGSDNGDIHDNDVYDNLQSGIYLACCGTGGQAPANGNTNTEVYDNNSYGNFNNGILSIEGKNNVIHDNVVNDNWNAGIQVWFPAEITVQDNDLDDNNTKAFNGNGSSGDAYGGIVVDGDASVGGTFAVKVIGNTVTNTGIGATTQKIGVRLDSPIPSDGYEVTNNFFEQHDVHALVVSQAGVTSFFDNSFDGAGTAMQNDDATTLDASGNWWGSNVPATVAASITGDVDYTPWLDVGTDTDGGTTGFQGDFSTLNVDDDSPQVGATGRVQEGVNLVTASIVNVLPGTYNANIILASSVTLNGAMAGVDARGRVVGAPSPLVESVLTAPAGKVLLLKGGSAGSVIDGFAFSGTGGATRGIESSSGPIDNVRILNNQFADFLSAAVFLNDNGDDIDIDQNEFDGAVGSSTLFHIDQDDYFGLHFTNNNVLNRATGTGLFVDGDHQVSPSVGRSPLISGNLFDGNETGANLGRFGFELGTITGNTFSNSGYDGLQGGIQNSTISNNLFDGNGRWGLALTGFGGSGDATRGAQDNTITGNTFSGNGYVHTGGGIVFSSGQFPGTISTNVANDNDIVGNLVGALYSGTETIDVTCNWWGHIDGPDAPSSPNPLGDPISGTTLQFAPWLDSSITGTPSCDQYGPNNVAPDGTGLCLSTTSTCETVPVVFNRLDTSSARGISVTFQLSAELQLCGTPGTSILQGTWLGAFGTTYGILDNGGGSYTVDQSILGTPCGVTTGGTLFTIDVTNTVPNGTGTITVTDVDVRDCGNPVASLPGIPGPPASILIDTTLPTAIADLAAAQVKTGNDGDGTTEITLTWGAVEAGATVEVYRKGFGDYPEYDDGTGAVPATPGTPVAALGGGWVLSSVTASPGVDETDTERDFMYFVAFVTDACGNVSAVSNQTDGTLNYHLGDFVPLLGGPLPLGDNLVDALDISKLGAHYGTQDGDALYLDTLDVGPTADNSTNGLPDTDNKIQFEDLIITSINFGDVSKPGAPPAAQNALSVSVPEARSLGATFEVALDLSSDGSVKGVSIPLRYNASVVEPVGYGPGELLDRQAGMAVVLSPAPGTLDAAVFGSSFTGEGRLGSVRFRVIAAGAPNIGLGEVIARDKDNQPVALDGSIRTLGQDPTLPSFTGLVGAAPNPFAAGTVIRFSMAEEGPAQVRIFAVDGRLVKTLLDGFQAAGEQAISWDGRDDSGRSTAAGTYLIQFRSRSTQQAERIVRLR